MLPTVERFFTGEYLSYGQGVTADDSSQAPSLQTLMTQVEPLVGLIKMHANAMGVTKSRAQASVWHMFYTLKILPPIIVSHSVLKSPLPLHLEACRLDSQTQRLVLPHCGQPTPLGETAERFGNLLFDHLAPLHHFLHEHFGVDEQVLWSNVSFRLGQFFPLIAAQLPQLPHIANDFKALRFQPHLGKEINPIHAITQQQLDLYGHLRVRGKCCLLHEVEGKSYCGDCPKSEENLKLRQANVT